MIILEKKKGTDFGWPVPLSLIPEPRLKSVKDWYEFYH